MIHEELSVFYPAPGVLQIQGTGANRLDFGSKELNAGFVFFLHKVVVVDLPVFATVFMPFASKDFTSPCCRRMHRHIYCDYTIAVKESDIPFKIKIAPILSGLQRKSRNTVS